MSRIPLNPSLGEFKDLSSDFVAELLPLDSLEGFKLLYEQFKKRHPKADHYPYAYRLGEAGKSSDDGEPGGSAGRPLLSLLADKDIEGAVIVARYFGGSKLGIPRLRRAFLSAAETAVEAARFGSYQTVYRYSVEVDYSTYEILKNNAKRFSFSLVDVNFDVNVRATVLARDKLDTLGEKVGLYDLDLGPAEETQVLKEE